jgi:hypothetical protein
LSTRLAISVVESLSLERHIHIVDALAMVFFMAMLFLTYFRPGKHRQETSP